MAGPMHERAWRPVLPCAPGAIPPDHGRPAGPRASRPLHKSGQGARPCLECSERRTGLQAHSPWPVRCTNGPGDPFYLARQVPSRRTTGVPPDRGRPARFTSPAREPGHVSSVPNVERVSRPIPHGRSDARTGLETRSTLPARCHPAGPRASRRTAGVPPASQVRPGSPAMSRVFRSTLRDRCHPVS
jgi:hypothetical protein